MNVYVILRECSIIYKNVKLEVVKKVLLFFLFIIYIYSDVMKRIQCPHPPHHRNGFVATCRLWTASGGVHALLVLEPTECSTSIKLGA